MQLTWLIGWRMLTAGSVVSSRSLKKDVTLWYGKWSDHFFTSKLSHARRNYLNSRLSSCMVPLTCGWYISCSCHSFAWLSMNVLVSWFQDFKSWALFLSLFESLAVMVVCGLACRSNGLLRTSAFSWLLVTYWIAGSL